MVRVLEACLDPIDAHTLSLYFVEFFVVILAFRPCVFVVLLHVCEESANRILWFVEGRLNEF